MRTCRRARGGFTIIEMMVVFIIIGAAVAIALPAFRDSFEEADIDFAARKVETVMRIARDSALRSGRPVTVLVDSTTTLVWLDSPAREPLDVETPTTGLFGSSMLSSGTRSGGFGSTVTRTRITVASAGWSGQGDVVERGTDLELPNSVRLEIASARAKFTFDPTGAAFADTIYLSTSAEARMITLDPWTGDVVIIR